MYKSMELCRGRHSTPAKDGAIFNNAINPLDLQNMANQAEEALDRCTVLDLYVTGLTVALIETVKICQKKGVKLTLWHFDRDSGSYYPQNL